MNVWYWLGATGWLIAGVAIGVWTGWRAHDRWVDACQDTGIEDQ